jgi:hypothetical protein
MAHRVFHRPVIICLFFCWPVLSHAVAYFLNTQKYEEQEHTDYQEKYFEVRHDSVVCLFAEVICKTSPFVVDIYKT